MRSGYNTNVHHRGTLFHVQTEDSGRANPHLITYLFHEGTILSSAKQSYAEYAEDDSTGDAVKHLMEDQHLGMLERLRSGALDGEIAERLGEGVFSEAPRCEEDEAGDTQPELAGAPSNPGSASGRRSPALPADAALDELVLDYLAERGSRSPGTR